MNQSIEKAIFGLQRIVENNNQSHIIKIDDNKIIVSTNENQLFGTLFYLFLLIFTPLSILIYYLNFDNTSSDIFWLLLLLTWYIYELRKILIGDNILTLNLLEGHFEIENINALFKKLFPKRRVLFSDVVKVTLEPKSIHTRSGRIRWNQLTVFDKETNKIVLTSFDDKLPFTTIGHQVKLIIDLILKEQTVRNKDSSR
jgi:hypothetical protein